MITRRNPFAVLPIIDAVRVFFRDVIQAQQEQQQQHTAPTSDPTTTTPNRPQQGLSPYNRENRNSAFESYKKPEDTPSHVAGSATSASSDNKTANGDIKLHSRQVNANM